MLRGTLSLIWILALVLAMASSALAADNGAINTTQTYQDQTESFTDTLFCSEKLYNITVTYNGVEHMTILPNGGITVTETETGTFTAVPADGTGPSYSGKFTFWSGGLLKPDDTGAFTFTITIHGMGSDGTDLQVHATFHDNANPNTERAFQKIMHCP